MEEISLTNNEKFLYHNSHYKDIKEFLNKDNKGAVNLDNILDKHPDLKKITFYEVSKEIGGLLLISGINNSNLELKLHRCEFGYIEIVDSNIKELKIKGRYTKKETKEKKSFKRIEISNSTTNRIIVDDEFNPIIFSIKNTSKINTLKFFSWEYLDLGIDCSNDLFR